MKLRTFFIVFFIFICFYFLCLYLAITFNENEYAIYFLYFALLCPFAPLLIDEIVTDIKDKKERTE